jgi:hypothetical protein
MWKWIVGGLAAAGVVGGAIWYEKQKAQANAGPLVQSSTYDTSTGSGTGDQSQPVGSAANPASAD